MDLTCAYYSLKLALSYGSPLSFILFFHILIQYFRPDVVGIDNRVKIVSERDILDSYDFVIIGSGSAGSVLANRLTEIENWTVLLLEAGGGESDISQVPGMVSTLQRTELDWQFKTEPMSTACLGMNNNQCLYPRGKLLGGCTSHNWMMYVRGNKRDYNAWRDLGNPGWGYDDVLPYFIKSENNSIPELQNSKYHGYNGYLSIEYPRDGHAPISENFLAAGVELGYKLVDVNGESQTGFGYVQNTLRNGLRCSVAKAFLRPVSHRKNLHVSIHSMAHKILVDETTKTAYGVQFRRNDEDHVVHVKKEVILSAGAIQSPQLLMLSGIGPKEHLEEIGIKVIHDSPGVGQNLQDHAAVGGLSYLYDTPTHASPDNSKASDSGGSGIFSLSDINEFLHEKRGPLYAFGGGQAQAFISTGAAGATLDYPDTQLVFGAAGDNEKDGYVAIRTRGLRDDFAKGMFEHIGNNVSYQITPLLLRPKSRGYIKLRDANVEHHPIMNANYFADPRDLDVLTRASLIIYNMSQTVAMKKINARPNPNLTPGCRHLIFGTYEYFKCHAQQYTVPLHHPSCTCKMGPANDSMAVVDSRLRVYGVKSLRVIDTSVMPNVVSGNTNAPTIMIAEKAADLIKEDFSHSYASVATLEELDLVFPETNDYLFS